MAKKKKGAGGSGRKSKPKPEFRSQVEDEIVDQLLYRFVALVKKGLALMLDNPSELTRTEFRRNPALGHTAEDIPGLVLWAAAMLTGYRPSIPDESRNYEGHGGGSCFPVSQKMR